MTDRYYEVLLVYEMLEVIPMARGNFGNTEQHRRAGRMGGKAPHEKRGLQAAPREVRERVARMGGRS